MNNPYWENVCIIADHQREKGLNKYGMALEDNLMSREKTLEMLQEELVDGLMYIEKAKDINEMSPNRYVELAMRTYDGRAINRLCDAIYGNDIKDAPMVINGILGLTGEAGEFADEWKKIIFHEKPMDEEHLKKELGDVMWYVAMICAAMSWSLEDVMKLNIEKLKARYPEGFTVEASANRKEGDV